MLLKHDKRNKELYLTHKASTNNKSIPIFLIKYEEKGKTRWFKIEEIKKH